MEKSSSQKNRYVRLKRSAVRESSPEVWNVDKVGGSEVSYASWDVVELWRRQMLFLSLEILSFSLLFFDWQQCAFLSRAVVRGCAAQTKN